MVQFLSFQVRYNETAATALLLGELRGMSASPFGYFFSSKGEISEDGSRGRYDTCQDQDSSQVMDVFDDFHTLSVSQVVYVQL